MPKFSRIHCGRRGEAPPPLMVVAEGFFGDEDPHFWGIGRPREIAWARRDFWRVRQRGSRPKSPEISGHSQPSLCSFFWNLTWNDSQWRALNCAKSFWASDWPAPIQSGLIIPLTSRNGMLYSSLSYKPFLEKAKYLPTSRNGLLTRQFPRLDNQILEVGKNENRKREKNKEGKKERKKRPSRHNQQHRYNNLTTTITPQPSPIIQQPSQLSFTCILGEIQCTYHTLYQKGIHHA